MIRKFLMASVGVVVLTGSAVAADLPSRAPPPIYVPPVPIFTWTGIYLGGQIGYAWGNHNTNYGVPGVGSFGIGYSPDGVIGGAHVGYNQQFNQFVIGLEGDVNGASLSHSSGPFYPFVASGNISSNVGIQGSIRGRIGYAFDRVLIYGTGGAAFGDVKNSISTAFGYNSSSSSRVGWTVGGGIEYAVTNNWSIRAEYRYTDFGTISQTPFNSFGGGFAQHRFTENQVQVGFSYKFDTLTPVGPVVAKY